MKFLTAPEVTLLATTCWVAEELPADAAAWTTDAASDGEKLIEFAGRQCYESWDNKAGRTNCAYIQNVLQLAHTSVIEHAQATLRFAAVSRSWSHEAVRHRHLSVSQLSQRYVPGHDVNFVVPPALRGTQMQERFQEACIAAMDTYSGLVARLEGRYGADVEGIADRTLRLKLAREAARSVLPNATETRLVLSGNLTAWRWFCIRRASQEADAEMAEWLAGWWRCCREWRPRCSRILSDG
jgi:thymidylate synthase (FAD)